MIYSIQGVYNKKIVNSTQLGLNCYSFTNGFKLNVWDQVNLVFYNIIPFVIMMTFNSLLIVNIRKKISTFNSKSTSSSSIKRPNLTVSLIVLTCMFLVMTTPATVMFAFFYSQMIATIGKSWLYFIDDISFLNHGMLFTICFVSNKKFRRTVLQLCRGEIAVNQTTMTGSTY